MARSKTPSPRPNASFDSCIDAGAGKGLDKVGNTALADATAGRAHIVAISSYRWGTSGGGDPFTPPCDASKRGESICQASAQEPFGVHFGVRFETPPPVPIGAPAARSAAVSHRTVR